VLIIDGLQVPNVSDEAKAAIEKLQGQVKDAQEQSGKLTADLATAKTNIQTKDGEIVGLNAKLKDAEVTPAKLQLLADARAKVIAAAQLLKPGITVDTKTDTAIRKEAVEAKLGDAAKDMTDDAITGAFTALTKDGRVHTTDTLRDAITATPAGSTSTAAIRDAARAASIN
jgi:hypothetical protein